MASIKYLLAFVALALVASLRVGADLAGSCTDISIFTKDMKDTEEIFSFAKKHLMLEIDLSTVPYRLPLINAWDHAIHLGDCPSTTFEDLAVLARCRPESRQGLKTLSKAFENYIKKCFSTVDFSKKIRSRTRSISNLFSGDVTKFIDSQFIDDFRKSNPGAPRMLVIAKVIERKYPHTLKSFSTVEGELLSEEKLARYLEKDLVKPCKSYENALKDLMYDFYEIGRFIGGDEFLIAQMSPEAQNGVFRYKVCENLRKDFGDEKTRDRLVKRVFKQISFQK